MSKIKGIKLAVGYTLASVMFGQPASAQDFAFELTVLQAEDDQPIADGKVQLVMFGKGIRINHSRLKRDRSEVALDSDEPKP